MTTETNDFTTDHRHPDLVLTASKLVHTAETAAERSQLESDQLIATACDALQNNDTGEHRTHILRAIRRESGVDYSELASAYDSHNTPKWNNSTLKTLLQDNPSFDYLVGSVVRFEACHHVNLVKKFVSKYVSSQDPNILNRSAEELFFYGYIGLSNALKGYNPVSGNTISTFAAYRINGAVRDGVRSESPVPKRLTTFVRAVESAEEKLTIALSRVPTREEIKEELGEQAKYLHLYPRLCRQASLDEMEGYNPSVEQDAAEVVESSIISEDLHDAMSELTETEKVAVRLIHGEGLAERKAAKDSGIPQGELARAAVSGAEKLKQQPKLQAWRNQLAAA